jgi:hypothetical protein
MKLDINEIRSQLELKGQAMVLRSTFDYDMNIIKEFQHSKLDLISLGTEYLTNLLGHLTITEQNNYLIITKLNGNN